MLPPSPSPPILVAAAGVGGRDIGKSNTDPLLRAFAKQSCGGEQYLLQAEAHGLQL